jgi:hypothetical protein
LWALADLALLQILAVHAAMIHFLVILLGLEEEVLKHAPGPAFLALAGQAVVDKEMVERRA